MSIERGPLRTVPNAVQAVLARLDRHAGAELTELGIAAVARLATLNTDVLEGTAKHSLARAVLVRPALRAGCLLRAVERSYLSGVQVREGRLRTRVGTRAAASRHDRPPIMPMTTRRSSTLCIETSPRRTPSYHEGTASKLSPISPGPSPRAAVSPLPSWPNALEPQHLTCP
jgi:hypothetical protein